MYNSIKNSISKIWFENNSFSTLPLRESKKKNYTSLIDIVRLIFNYRTYIHSNLIIISVAYL